MKAFALILSLYFICSGLSAQDRCHYHAANGFDTQIGQAFLRHFEEKLDRFLIQASTLRTQYPTYQIPVVVHVIHNGEAIGEGANIAREQIESQIAVLNEDFGQGTSSQAPIRDDFLPLAASAHIQFVLAPTDPQGIPLEEAGVHRYDGRQATWTRAEINEILKPATIFDPYRYLNIWTVAFDNPNYIGEAQWPQIGLIGLSDERPDQTDGIMIGYQYFGSRDKYPEGNYADSSFDLGRSATHEVGHWLGLRHTFENCDRGDYVADTPPQRGASRGCPDHQKHSCGTLDMWENFMDYTDDACMRWFTHGQVARMRAVLEMDSMRNSVIRKGEITLSSPENLINLYPNPTDGILYLDLTLTPEPEYVHLTLFAPTGQKIWRARPDRDGVTAIDFTSYEKGIYLLRYQRDSDGFTFCKKIMVRE
ncbi:MAG: M43 family zinc metalloprotease [Bacteroidota bacterium]